MKKVAAEKRFTVDQHVNREKHKRGLQAGERRMHQMLLYLQSMWKEPLLFHKYLCVLCEYLLDELTNEFVINVEDFEKRSGVSVELMMKSRGQSRHCFLWAWTEYFLYLLHLSVDCHSVCNRWQHFAITPLPKVPTASTPVCSLMSSCQLCGEADTAFRSCHLARNDEALHAVGVIRLWWLSRKTMDLLYPQPLTCNIKKILSL
ncbi:hypothetical protein C0J52_10746 [Blattella germanica]|nr:hypothetical protein C0J52_10746 [Blattella germanica]